MNVLQVCFKLPYPPNDGGAYSLYNSALSLLKTEQVNLTVLAMKQLKNKDDAAKIPTSFIDQTDFSFVEINNNINPFKAFLTIFQSTSYLANRFYSKSFENALLELIHQHSFDIIQLEHSYLAVYLEAIRKNFSGKIVLRAQNVEHKIWESYLAQRKGVTPSNLYLRLMTKRLKTLETNALKKIDGLICLSKDDEAAFQILHPNLPKTVIPIGFDAEKLTHYFPKENSTKIYHLGSMDWLPNIQGIDWFLEQVLPKLQFLTKDFSLHLAGKNMSEKLKTLRLENVVVDGEVPDSLTYQADKSILIVPLLSGGGIRVKIIEALALGKVIVSTSKGADGILFTHNENILIADTPEDFAQALLFCLESPELRKKLSKNAKILFEKQYQLSPVGAQTVGFYEKLIAFKK